MPTVPHDRLKAATHALLAAMGSSDREAEVVADHLVEANLKGHDSHGVGMAPHYVRNWQAGTLVLNRALEITRDDGVFLIGDGGGGHGQVVAKDLTERAIARAGADGVCVAGLTNAHHIGRVGAYGEWCAAAGLVSIHFVNVGRPFALGRALGRVGPALHHQPDLHRGARDAQPAGDHLDFATSEVARARYGSP